MDSRQMLLRSLGCFEEEGSGEGSGGTSSDPLSLKGVDKKSPLLLQAGELTSLPLGVDLQDLWDS